MLFPEIVTAGDVAALIYLWNPLTIVTCVGSTTSPIENLMVVLSLYGACSRKYLVHFSTYYFLFFVLHFQLEASYCQLYQTGNLIPPSCGRVLPCLVLSKILVFIFSRWCTFS